MKKSILIIFALACAFNMKGQNINPENDNVPNVPPPAEKKLSPDSLLSRWCLDVNATGGLLNQQFTSGMPGSNYLNAINYNISGLNFKDGFSLGLDAQVGYFFGKKRHFGIGTGFLYMYQQGNATLNNFQVTYQSVDEFHNIFRQIITADNPVKEKLNISNVNIPILFKYKTKFTDRLGFTADAGILINIEETNKYTTNASFDYEAIYKYQTSEGTTTTVYDNSAIPSSGDLLITKAQYMSLQSSTSLNTYFNNLRSEGYNVGLGVNPNNNSGYVSYKTISLGAMVRPAISYYLSDRVALNFGLYYVYQNFSNNAQSDYKITDKVGSYSSVLNSVSKAVNNSGGISVGVRFFLCKPKTAAPAPVEDTTTLEIVPEEDTVSAPPSMPKVEKQPEEKEEEIAPILFDIDKATIKKSDVPILNETINEATKNEKATIEVHGYTDITGSRAHNKVLSKKRAVAVKKYLVKKGVNPNAIKAVGHGVANPAASNKTREGRARNRRVIIKLKEN